MPATGWSLQWGITPRISLGICNLCSFFHKVAIYRLESQRIHCTKGGQSPQGLNTALRIPKVHWMSLYDYQETWKSCIKDIWHTGQLQQWKRWKFHPQRHSKSVWTGCWATWLGCRCPCLLRWSWSGWHLRVPFNLNSSMNCLLHYN